MFLPDGQTNWSTNGMRREMDPLLNAEWRPGVSSPAPVLVGPVVSHQLIRPDVSVPRRVPAAELVEVAAAMSQ